MRRSLEIMTSEARPIPHRDQIAAVVFNPAKVPVLSLREAVAVNERQHGWAATLWFETGEHDAGTAAARAAIAASPDVILVAGGDGTVRAVAQEVHPTGIPLALLPAGTANLLARNLRLTLDDLPRAVETAFTGVNRNVDIAVAATRGQDGPVTRSAFLVMAGIGLDADMAEYTNPVLKKRIGWGAYVDPIARSVIGNKRTRLQYRVDKGPKRSLRAHTIIVGNCGTLTANILLLPDAIVDDGLLDVVVFRPRGALGWARIGSRLAAHSVFNKFRAGRWVMRRTPRLHGLDYVQASRFDAIFDAPQLMQLDGDSIGLVRSVTLTVFHEGLTLRVPHPSSDRADVGSVGPGPARRYSDG